VIASQPKQTLVPSATCFYVLHCYQRLNAPEHASSLDLFALLPRTRRLALVSAASIDFKDFTSVSRDGLVAYLIPISVFVSSSHDVGSLFSRRCLREGGVRKSGTT